MSADEYNRPPLEEAHAAWLRGVGYARREQWQQAIRALTQALDADPGHVEARRELARSHAALGQVRQAARLLEVGLERQGLNDTQRVALLQLLGRISVQSGDYARASEAYEEAMVVVGHTGGALLDQLAEVLCRSGDYRRGFELFLQAGRQQGFGPPSERG